jgi:hypothetical protein
MNNLDPVKAAAEADLFLKIQLDLEDYFIQFYGHQPLDIEQKASILILRASQSEVEEFVRLIDKDGSKTPSFEFFYHNKEMFRYGNHQAKKTSSQS